LDDTLQRRCLVFIRLDGVSRKPSSFGTTIIEDEKVQLLNATLEEDIKSKPRVD
jgi:hypothetical protein